MTSAYPVAPIEMALFAVLSGIFLLLVIATAIRRGRDASAASRDPAGRIGVVIQTLAIFIACLGPIKPTLANGGVQSIAGTALALLTGIGSLWLFYASSAVLKKNWSIDARMREDHQLVRAGPYALVRHPIYLGLLLFLLALGLSAGHYLQLLLAVPAYLWGTAIRTRAEDKLLAQKFGSEFETYRRSTPALIPKLG